MSGENYIPSSGIWRHDQISRLKGSGTFGRAEAGSATVWPDLCQFGQSGAVRRGRSAPHRQEPAQCRIWQIIDLRSRNREEIRPICLLWSNNYFSNIIFIDYHELFDCLVSCEKILHTSDSEVVFLSPSRRETELPIGSGFFREIFGNVRFWSGFPVVTDRQRVFPRNFRERSILKWFSCLPREGRQSYR